MHVLVMAMACGQRFTMMISALCTWGAVQKHQEKERLQARWKETVSDQVSKLLCLRELNYCFVITKIQ